MGASALDEIEVWSTKQSSWRRDCLRRLAISSDLTGSDFDELLAMIRSTVGLDTPSSPPAPIPFTKAHFGGAQGTPIVLKRLENVQNVNRLLSTASLDFCPKKLTIVYGRNGSGKSGYVRILRTACRTRVENPAKLKVLANAYGQSAGPQSADIVIETEDGEKTISWKPGMAADPLLAQVAVFDTQSAQLYVDGGNQIRYLPFGLALPHRLNSVCLILKDRLEAERTAVVGEKLGLTVIEFPSSRLTEVQKFNEGVTADTTDEVIAKVASFSEEDQRRLSELTKLLASDAAAAADLSALIMWGEAIVLELKSSAEALDDAALDACTRLHDQAITARRAAELAAGKLFIDEPLPGVGTGTWRALWMAARDYSVTEAYHHHTFPVTSLDGQEAACVLCQQLLKPEAAARMERFRNFMDDTLDAAAKVAERALAETLAGLPGLRQSWFR